MKKLLTILIISLSLKSYAQKSVDTVSVTVERTIPRALSDSIGAFQTDWKIVKIYDTTNRFICIEKQLYKLEGSRDIYVRKRKTVYVYPKKSKKEIFVDSLLQLINEK